MAEKLTIKEIEKSRLICAFFSFSVKTTEQAVEHGYAGHDINVTSSTH